MPFKYQRPPQNLADRIYEWVCLDCHNGRECFWCGVAFGGTAVLIAAACVTWAIAAAGAR